MKGIKVDEPNITTWVKDLKFNQIKISGVEGQNSNEWILLDLGDIVINIMSDDSRKLFDLESLWDPALKWNEFFFKREL